MRAEIKEAITSLNAPIGNSELPNSCPRLSLESVDEVTEFEKYLVNESNFSQVVRTFQIIAIAYEVWLEKTELAQVKQ